MRAVRQSERPARAADVLDRFRKSIEEVVDARGQLLFGAADIIVDVNRGWETRPTCQTRSMVGKKV